MKYSVFCQILNDNLVYAFVGGVSDELREEYQQDWYIEFKQSYWQSRQDLTPTEQVTGWMREHFEECSFDSHSFQLKDLTIS